MNIISTMQHPLGSTAIPQLRSWFKRRVMQVFDLANKMVHLRRAAGRPPASTHLKYLNVCIDSQFQAKFPPHFSRPVSSFVLLRSLYIYTRSRQIAGHVLFFLRCFSCISAGGLAHVFIYMSKYPIYTLQYPIFTTLSSSI